VIAGFQLKQFLTEPLLDLGRIDDSTIVQGAPVRTHCQIWAREISAVAASSIRLLIGTQPLPESQAARYCSADADVVAQAGLGDVPSLRDRAAGRRG
jgi:hypothetical protein